MVSRPQLTHSWPPTASPQKKDRPQLQLSAFPSSSSSVGAVRLVEAATDADTDVEVGWKGLKELWVWVAIIIQ